jgi:hypothetical protein
MTSKLYERKVRPGTWKFRFKWFTKKKPKMGNSRVIATQVMKKVSKDRYTGRMTGKRYKTKKFQY